MCRGCQTCKFAEWDYVTYYNTTQKRWFVCDCMKDNDFTEDKEYCGDYQEGAMG